MRPSARGSRRGLTAAAGCALLLLASCSPGDSGDAGGSAGPGTSTVSSTVGTSTAVSTSTVTMTSAPTAAGTAQPPPPTPEPPPTDAPCPYLSDADVESINGQRAGQTQVVAVLPYPICRFTRTDGDWMGEIRIVQADSPESATAAVDVAAPVDSSDPANLPAGWAGGSTLLADRSVYAVSKGTIAVIAESNQLQTIKPRQMAVQTIAALGL